MVSNLPQLDCRIFFCWISMFISFSSKLLKYISIAISLFVGSKVDFDLNLFRSNSISSFQKSYFKRNVLSYAFSSILSFALLIWLLVGTNFNPLDNNEISALVSFCLDKLATFLLTNLHLICPFKVNKSLPSSVKWLQPVRFCLFKTCSSWKHV